MQTVKEKITPNLRFPGFSDEWKVFKIHQKFKYVSTNSLSRDELLAKEGISNIHYGDIHTLLPSLLDTQKINLPKISKLNYRPAANDYCIEGDLVMADASEDYDDIGKSLEIIRTANKSTVAGLHTILLRTINKNYAIGFMGHLFNSPTTRLKIKKIAQGAKVLGIPKKYLSDLDIITPTLNEQQKISGFLSVVDEKIESLEQKLELSKKFKKGLLQKLFPKKGQTNPELRFKKDDCSNFTDWQSVPLSKFLIQKIRAVDTPGRPYLGLGVRSHFKGLMQRPNSNPDKIMMDTLYIVKEGDLVVNITFAWEGAVAIAGSQDDGGLVSHRFPTYRFNENIVLGELFRYVFPGKKFKYELGLASPGGAGRNRVLSKKEFLKIVIQVPSVEEQKKIAHLLNSIDEEMKDQERKLEQAKKFKKALLQQMFV